MFVLIPVEPVSLPPHASRVLEPDVTRVRCRSHGSCSPVVNILSRMWSGCMAVWLLQVPQWGLQALSLLTGMWVASLTEGTHLVALL